MVQHGNRATACTTTTGSWHDDPGIPYASLIGHVAALKAGKDIERPTEELTKERDRLPQEYGALLDEQSRPAFEELLALSRTVFPYVEEHKFYCDYWFQSRFFNKVREFGALLAEHGFFEDGEDVFQLSRHEAMEALEELSLTWATGGLALGPHHWPPIVARRKQLLERLAQWTPPPALGTMPEAVNDPIVVMLWGITPQRLQQWAAPQDGHELTGSGASAGVVEGPARVVTRPRRPRHRARGRDPRLHGHLTGVGADLLEDRRRPSPTSAASCPTPRSSAREYGMPAVVGTGTRHVAHPDRPAAARRRLHRRRDDPRRRVMSETHTRPLDELRAADAALFGGKSASLGELIASGIPVPPGFAVSAEAYRRDAPVPEALRAELEERYAELGSPPVAVRSSALGEDSADASFAGQQETYLWVRSADAVCDAVRDCWASLFSPEAISYRARIEQQGEPAMGVTVQRMVDAEVSGVLFTCNPVSGDPSTVAINASWGLGLAVVGGEVTPDEYRVSKVTRRGAAPRDRAPSTSSTSPLRTAPARCRPTCPSSGATWPA